VEPSVVARHNGIPARKVIARYRRAQEEISRLRRKAYADHARRFAEAQRRIRRVEREVFARLEKEFDFPGLRRRLSA